MFKKNKLVSFLEQFKKLTKRENSYYANSKKIFSGNISVDEFAKEAAEWAYNNTYHGHFKNNEGRSINTVLTDALVGKIGEFLVYKFFKTRGYDPSYPDLKTRSKGEWDDGDMIVDGKKMSIKTSSSVSTTLRLRRSDWNVGGDYLYGSSGVDDSYKAVFFCRIKPDLRKIFANKDYSMEDFVDECSNISWIGEVTGFVRKDDVANAIKEGMILEKSSKLDGKMEIYFDQIYFQAGCLRDPDDIPKRG